eukprot:TRINITY_DN6926_c0_g1_i2.p1 TRINITY_DN6926_c0_g1~~TRINITY_DN6926_c0_g1_i2.p1  ORF type:complete len:282 (+),score=83.64 TRINITY_DN6926_c0_g1_i2:152-997(+)
MCIRDRYQRRVRGRYTADMKFVVAYDGSTHSKEALQYTLPYLEGAEVHVFAACIPEASIFVLGNAELILKTALDAAETLCAEATATIGDRAVSVVSVARAVNSNSEIGEALAQHAQECQADCIVMGTRGQGEFKSKLFGSVAQNVLFENCEVPVLIVHPGAAAAREEHGHSVLFAVDGSARSLAAVQRGAAFVGSEDNVLMFHAAKGPAKYLYEGGADLDFGPDDVVKNPRYEEEYLMQEEQHRELQTQAWERLAAAKQAPLCKDNMHLSLIHISEPTRPY